MISTVVSYMIHKNKMLRQIVSRRLRHTLAFTNHNSSSSKQKKKLNESIVILHGIMGSGLNFRTMARSIAKAYPNSNVITLDLPGHGDTDMKVDTVQGCAEAVEETCRDIGLSEPTIVVGHSFGGKVALKMYERQREKKDSRRRTSAFWILDSTPGILENSDLNVENPNSVAGVIRSCQSLNPPFESKNELMTSLQDLGVAPAIQHWMTTNIRRDEGENAFVWKFDLNVIENLFQDYGRQDMWPVMSLSDNSTSIHLVRATRNSTWKKQSTKENLDLAVRDGGLIVHDIDAGHWLHAEKPKELFDLMNEHSFCNLLRE
jgi:pimeloyl-ACP methyl ester carboxylesterase